MKRPVRYIVQGGVIAALYAVFTLVQALMPGNLAFGPIQLRISEAMMVLPLFTPAAVPGLTVGCLIANLLGSNLGWADWVFGTLATLVSAILVRALKRWKWISPVYPTVINGLVVAAIIAFLSGQVQPALFWPTAAFVAAGEALVCFGLGLPLMMLMERLRSRLFPEELKRPAVRTEKPPEGPPQ